MKDRIIQIMKAENMNASRFSEAIGVRRGTISHIVGERNQPSLDVVKGILRRFQTIDPDWLLNGVGNMRRTSTTSPTIATEATKTTTATTTTASTANKSNGSNNDLFSQSNAPQKRQTGDNMYTDVNQPNDDVYKSNGHTKEPVKEIVIYKEAPQKKIDNLFILYSDRTYETFVTEK